MTMTAIESKAVSLPMQIMGLDMVVSVATKFDSGWWRYWTEPGYLPHARRLPRAQQVLQIQVPVGGRRERRGGGELIGV